MFDNYINKMEYAATDPKLMEFVFRGCCKEIGKIIYTHIPLSFNNKFFMSVQKYRGPLRLDKTSCIRPNMLVR